MIQSLLRVLAPASWVALAIDAVVAKRSRRSASLLLHAGSFVGSAFVTRLAIDHHESRYQIALFVGAAAALEAARFRHSAGRRGSFAFWAVASVGATIGVVAARPLAHRFGISPW